MCTVTYIPTGNNNYILSSNRDEQANRSPHNLTQEQRNDQTLVFPRDNAAGGTWISISDNGRVVVLLNGAFVKHKHEPPYRLSRGLMVLHFFDYPTAKQFIEEYDFKGVEPFTMIMIENNTLTELRWDGQQRHNRLLDNQEKYIWSSATLYPPDIQEKRLQWFQNWLQQNNTFNRETILNFHKNGGNGDIRNDLIMNRGIVQTVSISNIVKENNGLYFYYNDLINNHIKTAFLKTEE